MKRRKFFKSIGIAAAAAGISGISCASQKSKVAKGTLTAQRQNYSPLEGKTTRVILLGTGTPNADPDRSGPGIAIIVNSTPYLVDFGPGVVRRAAAAYRAGIQALKVQHLKRAFLTHLHSDHTAGYPDLIFTPWVLGRTEPLEVYGPAGIREMTEHILLAYQQDIDIRLTGLEPANDSGYKVNVHEVEPGIIYQDDNVTITAFSVTHGNWPLAFGFKFSTPDAEIVISGDTTYCDNLIEHSKGCNVLVHEVYSVAGFKTRSEEWQKYHASFHTSAHELGKLATQVQPSLLVLYHQLLWGTTPEELLNEIRQFYDGKVVFGNDLDIF